MSIRIAMPPSCWLTLSHERQAPHTLGDGDLKGIGLTRERAVDEARRPLWQ